MQQRDNLKVFAGWTSFSAMRKEAENGDPGAQCRMGEFHLYGLNTVTIDYAQAARWFTLAADQEFARGMGKLGLLHEIGLGVTMNESRAVVLYREAAERGDASARLSLAVLYENGECGLPGDAGRAAALYKDALYDLEWQAEDFGNAVAQNELAWMYATGRGVEQDDAQAISWYRRAAAQGHALAQRALGKLYEESCVYVPDRVVVRDYDEAVHWYRKAAEQGEREALSRLARMYDEGWGVKREPERAFALWRRAAALGLATAQYTLGSSLVEGEEGLDADPREAAYWFFKAAAQGLKRAQESLGVMYRTGRGVKQNEAAADYWFARAEERSEHGPLQPAPPFPGDDSFAGYCPPQHEGRTERDFLQRLALQ